MGIKDLVKYLSKPKKHVPYLSTQRKEIQDFRFKKLGIDMNLLFFRYMTSNFDTGRAFSNTISYLNFLKKNDFDLYLIFDGPNKLPEKNDECNVRINRSMERYNKLNELIEEAKDIDDESDNNKLIKLKSLEKQLNKKEIKVKINRMKRQLNIPGQVDFLILYWLVKILGFKTLIAYDEGDILLAYLYRIGEINSVLSRDSDFLAHGIEIMIIDIPNRGNEVIYYSLKEVLAKLKMTQGEFRTFCILSGCDYSKRQRGFGSITLHKLFLSDKKNEIDILVKKSEKFNFSMKRFSNTDGYNFSKFRETLDEVVSEDDLEFISEAIDNNYDPEIAETIKSLF